MFVVFWRFLGDFQVFLDHMDFCLDYLDHVDCLDCLDHLDYLDYLDYLDCLDCFEYLDCLDYLACSVFGILRNSVHGVLVVRLENHLPFMGAWPLAYMSKLTVAGLYGR